MAAGFSTLGEETSRHLLPFHPSPSKGEPVNRTTPTQTKHPTHKLLLTTEQLATLQEALADAQDEHHSINPSSPHGEEISTLIDYIEAHVVERAQPVLEEGALRVFILCDENTTWREHGVLHREGFCPHEDLPTHNCCFNQ